MKKTIFNNIQLLQSTNCNIINNNDYCFNKNINNSIPSNVTTDSITSCTQKEI